MRIALWNGSGLDNLGDQLIDHVNRIELGRRLGDSSFQTFAPWPCDGVPLARIDSNGRWNGEGEFDAIVIGGGALLLGPPFVHPSLQTCYLGPYPERFRDRCPAIWNAVCFNAQFLPALQEPWRSYVRTACQRLAYCSVRNAGSAELLAECEVSEPVIVVPDPVIALRPPQPRRKHNCGRRRVGLAVGAVVQAESFLARLGVADEGWDWNPQVQESMPRAIVAQNAARELAQQQALFARIAEAVAPLRTTTNLEVCGFGGVYGDRQAASKLAALLDCPLVSFHDSLGAGTIDWILSLDCLIASRLHACILALVVGTPLVAIDPYLNPITGTSKVREFMADGDLLAGYVPLHAFLDGDGSLGEFIEQAVRCQQQLPLVHSELSRKVHDHFDRLSEIIRNPRHL
jgi:polysaccharide pyruvyl transferase WcaK-like protein